MRSVFVRPVKTVGMFLWLGLLPLMADGLESELEKEATAIEGMLIAPCCWRQPVAVHYSPAADEVRAEVRKMLGDGQTRQAILDSYVEEYGNQILAKPPAEGFNLLAYSLPVVFLIAGAAVALMVVRKLRPVKAERPVAKASETESKYSERLERELWGD